MFAFLFHSLDELYCRFFLPLFGNLWELESRMRGVKLGRRAGFLGRPIVRIHRKSRVLIGNEVSFLSDSRRCSSGNLFGPVRLQTHLRSASIIIGSKVGLNGTSIVCRSTSICIGDGTIIAPNVVIMDSPYHRLWPAEARLTYEGNGVDQPVVIENNVWIGSQVLILPGTHIGQGAVIGARSVVNGKIPPNCLAVGSPAKVVRELKGE